MTLLDELRSDPDSAERLGTDFPHYCEQLLKIRPKQGALIPFRLNKAQLTLHKRLEELRSSTGMVRAIVSKASPSP